MFEYFQCAWDMVRFLTFHPLTSCLHSTLLSQKSPITIGIKFKLLSVVYRPSVIWTLAETDP